MIAKLYCFKAEAELEPILRSLLSSPEAAAGAKSISTLTRTLLWDHIFRHLGVLPADARELVHRAAKQRVVGKRPGGRGPRIRRFDQRGIVAATRQPPASEPAES